MKTAYAIFMVFVGCCSNVVFMEILVKEDPGIGNLVTFSQFLVIALEGFVRTSKFGTVKPNISIKNYLTLVVLFFITNVCNNYAFDFNVPMPLHMIFRAGSLITNMVMGILILKKEYSFSKYLSVGMITLGIFICTIISGKDVKSTATRGPPTTHYEDFFWWTIGIALLIIALFVSARMGIYQEVLYRKHGKHPKEALFYTHLLPLPGFLLLFNNICDHALLAYQSKQILILSVPVPRTLFYLAADVVTQYVCISSVYVLTTECTSLTVTLVITLRKFLSLIFSIVYFQNAFTVYHWIGTTLVFVGTMIFTEIYQKLIDKLVIHPGAIDEAKKMQ